MQHKHSFLKAGFKGENGLGISLVTIILVVIGWIAAQGLAIGLLYALKGPGIMDMATQSFNPEAFDPLGLSLILLSFGGGTLTLYFCIRGFHKRKFLSLITPLKKLNWSKIFFAVFVWFCFMALAELISYLLYKDIYTFSFEWRSFIPLFIVALIFIPIQTSFEEIFMRGYLLQTFGLAFKRPWLSMIITSVIFGLLHIANPEIKEFGFGILFYYIGFGLVMGLMTLLDESLEIPLGIHAMNNFYASVFVTFPESALPTKALLSMSEMNIQWSIIAWVIMTFLAFLIFGLKYKWYDWRKLFQKIEPEVDELLVKLEY